MMFARSLPTLPASRTLSAEVSVITVSKTTVATTTKTKVG
jgi:hypothetical protein